MKNLSLGLFLGVSTAASVKQAQITHHRCLRLKLSAGSCFAGSRIPKAREIILKALINAGGSFLSQGSGDWRTENAIRQPGEGIWAVKDSPGLECTEPQSSPLAPAGP